MPKEEAEKIKVFEAVTDIRLKLIAFVGYVGGHRSHSHPRMNPARVACAAFRLIRDQFVVGSFFVTGGVMVVVSVGACPPVALRFFALAKRAS